jgi:CheY-like chemotaxis protein
MEALRTKTVLVVDDEHEIRQLAISQLREAGYSTLEAPTAEQALAVLEERSPDVILLDLDMPGMGGLGLLSELQADRLNDAPSVVAFSAYLDIDLVFNKTKDLGCSGHVLKPYDRQQLLDAIDVAVAAQSE